MGKQHSTVWIRPLPKPLVWRGTARQDVRDFPVDARRDAGLQLFRVQEGKEPADWKPMPDVGAGVREIRIHTTVEHRILIVTRFAGAIYVLHAFEKKSRKTSKRDLVVARRRYRELIANGTR